jgi:hypothetical protein
MAEALTPWAVASVIILSHDKQWGRVSFEVRDEERVLLLRLMEDCNGRIRGPHPYPIGETNAASKDDRLERTPVIVSGVLNARVS